MRLKKIKGYEGYHISDIGHVYSDKYRDRRKLKSRLNSKGYFYVNLSKNGKYKSKVIHRLVATHFVKNEKNKPQVNHIDGNKKNNHYLNLEFVTQSENSKHAYAAGLITSLKNGQNKGEKNANSKITEPTAIKIKTMLRNGLGIASTSRNLNVSYSIVRGIKRGKSWAYLDEKLLNAV